MRTPSRRLVTIGASAALGAVAAARLLHWLIGRASTYELTIRRFEREPPRPGSVVFVGSSSFRFWRTLAADLAPLPVVNRGFGGAQIDHVNAFARRILPPLRPRAVLLYAGDNDLAWGKSVDAALADLERFVALARELAPGAPIYFVSAKLSPSRRALWPALRELNRRAADYAAGTADVRFVDVATPMLDARGEPRRELFRWDRLHLSPAGYAVWTSVLRPRLLADLG